MRAAVLAAVAGGLAAVPAQADRASVCEGQDGLWSDRSEFIQITGRAACELTPESPGSTLLQLQFEYPTDVAEDPAGSKQLATYIGSRIKHYQGQFAGDLDRGEIAVGVTYEEQSAGTARTVVFTESAFTKGVRQPVTQKLTQTFTLSSSSSPVVVIHPDNAAPVPPEGTATGVAPAPTAPGTTAPEPATPATTAPAPPVPPTAPTPPRTAVPTTGGTAVRPLATAPAQR